MEYTRLLKHMMSGADVRAVKDRLVALGYLYAATHDTFGDDTLAAVKAFQTDNGLEVDGIVGPGTWVALFDGWEAEAPAEPEQPADAPAVGATEPSEMAATLGEGDVYIYCPTMAG